MASSVHRFRHRAPLSAAVALAALLASGCATVETYVPVVRSLGVYKIDINQGNYLTQDMVGKLKEGQTRAQVRTILGTPLVTSAFRDDRWDYVYEFARQGRVVEHRAFTVYFVGDRLARWEGDEMPPSVAELNRAAIDKTLGNVPSAEDPGILDWLLGLFRR
ncbi:MAG: outer membrane protein assembly factor BamE [Betaproteobacteria bacterium]|nr:outer membrane protein assembly factor BamE [Betaproteobacteria bacterium]